MNADEARRLVLDALASVAPETDTASIDPDRPFRDQADLDSIDFLNFILALQRLLGIEIPDDQCLRFTTLDGCMAALCEPAQ